jgi:hypothetical protein
MRDSGLNMNTLKTSKFFRIPVSKFEQGKVIIFTAKKFKFQGSGPEPIDFVNFNEETFSEAAVIPQEMIDYYKKCAENNKKPFLFVFIPHILYRGSLDVSDCEVVEIKI